MVNVTDPTPRRIPAGTDVSFHYQRRVWGLLVFGGAAGFVGWWLSRRDWVQHDEHLGLWIVLVIVAGVLVAASAVLLIAERKEQDPARHKTVHAWVVATRWLALAASALSATHFGHTARLTGHVVNIVQIELAASPQAAQRCDCRHDLVHAIDRDFWFIAAYVLLLGLVAFWAGAYFRIQRLRHARVTITVAAVVAGLFDVVEDLMMRDAIQHHPMGDVRWNIASICAWAKFGIALVVIVYALAGAFAWWATPKWVRLACWMLPKDARETAKPAPNGTHETTTTVAEAEKSTASTTETLEKPTHQDGLKRSVGGAIRMRRGEEDESPSALGIALSGGGIRASSISLGALQILETAGTGKLGWGNARAVTAVSGGSNMAAGWSIARSSYEAGSQGGNPARVEPGDLEPEPWRYDVDGKLSPEERHLVDNLGYLVAAQPRGSSTDPAAPDSARKTKNGQSYRPAAYATVISGLTVNTLVLVSMLWLITRPAGWAIRTLSEKHGTLNKSVPYHLISDRALAAPGVTFLIIGFVALLLWVAVSQLSTGGPIPESVQGAAMHALKNVSYAAMALGAALLLVLTGYVALVGLAAHFTVAAIVAAISGSSGVIGSVIRILRKPAARFTPMLGGLVFIIVGLSLAGLSSWTAAEHGVTWEKFTVKFWDWRFSWESGWNWVAVLVFLVLVQLLITPERWSLAPFYRGKLRMAYATYRTKVTGGGPESTETQVVETYCNDNLSDGNAQREPALYSFTKTGDTPPPDGVVPSPLIVCATSTVSSRAVRAHYGTPALSMTFDPNKVILHLPQDERGTWLDYSASTQILDRLGRKLHKRMTTMFAVAISSAAVSPAMGRVRIGPTSMLLTFFNVRLGVWVANPRYAAQLEAEGLAGGTGDLGYPRTGLGYLFKEFFGIHDLDDPYLYLTDGGHWENTGLVEMLRRSDITEVVCVDADDGPGDATNSLGKAIAIAPLECGVRLDISLDPLRAELSESRAPAYAPRTVNIGFVVNAAGEFVKGQPVGIVWYCKPGLSKDMPSELLAFHERYPDYPRTNTVDQFYDTSTFVAYRDLGRHNARQIVAAREALQSTLGFLLGPAVTDVGATLSKLATADDAHWVVAELHRAASATSDPAAFCSAVEKAMT